MYTEKLQELIGIGLEELIPADEVVIGTGSFFVRFSSGVVLFWKDIGGFFITMSAIEKQMKFADVDPLVFDSFRESSAKAVLAILQGKLVLHAACVQMKGKNMAILGDNGAGKSTTVSLLVNQGYTCLTEDEIIIERLEEFSFKERNKYLKLWDNDFNLMKHAGKKLLPDLNKKVFVLNQNQPNQTLHTIDYLVFLQWGEKDEVKQLQFSERIAALTELAKGYFVMGNGFKATIFQQCAKLPSVEAVRITRKKTEGLNTNIIKQIEQLV